MLENHSRQILSKSQLIRHYQNANEKVFGIRPWVQESTFPKFVLFEEYLKKNNISCRIYAYTVVHFLAKWTRQKGLKFVPINVFLGKWALERYMKVHNSSTVNIAEAVEAADEELLLYSELLVARIYIMENTRNGNVVRFKDIVDRMRETLEEDWLDAYDSKIGRPIDEALERLCEEYNLPHARNYADIVTMMHHAR